MIYKNVRLLIVEDDKDICEEYKKIIENHIMLQFIGQTGSQDEALEILQTENIDAVILDLELPDGSGIFILEKLSTLNIPKPFIAVVTNVTSNVIYETVRNLGADYICSKRDLVVSPDTPFSIIEASEPFRKDSFKANDLDHAVNTRTQESMYSSIIDMELSRLHFDPKLTGTRLIKASILYVLMNDIKDIHVTKHLYPALSEMFESNIGNIEKNIRNSIEKVWTQKKPNQIKQLYPYEWSKKTGRPTNTQFIFNIAEKIRRH